MNCNRIYFIVQVETGRTVVALIILFKQTEDIRREKNTPCGLLIHTDTGTIDIKKG